jgi:hypothetical protein
MNNLIIQEITPRDPREDREEILARIRGEILV